MCGIVGVVGDINYREKKVFRDLLVIDQIRGLDSTGVIVINNKGEFVCDKDLGTPHDGLLQTSTLFDKKGVVNNYNIHGLIGHNRAATAGKITVNNAHPFISGNIAGVHNGTLKLPHCTFEDKNKYDVDSEALINAINEEGISETIPKTCGAWSLVWYDQDDKTVNFIRNDQRPMFYQYSKDKKTLFFASEGWMIDSICERHEVELCADKAIKTEVNKLYQADLGVTNFFKGIDFVKYSEDIEGLEPPKSTYTGRSYGYDDWGYGYGANSHYGGRTTSFTKGGGKEVYEDGRLVEVWKNGILTWTQEDGEIIGGKPVNKSLISTTVEQSQKKESSTSEEKDLSIREAHNNVRELGDGSLQIFLPYDYVSSDISITVCSMYEGYPVRIFYKTCPEVFEMLTKEENQGKWFMGKTTGYATVDEPWNEYDGYLHMQGNSIQGPFDFYGQGDPYIQDLKIRDMSEEFWGDCEDLIEGRNGVLLTKSSWEAEIKKDSCQFCQTNHVDFKDATQVQWIGDGGYVCPSCSHHYDYSRSSY